MLCKSGWDHWGLDSVANVPSYNVYVKPAAPCSQPGRAARLPHWTLDPLVHSNYKGGLTTPKCPASEAEMMHQGSRILKLPIGPPPDLNQPSVASDLHPRRTWPTSLPPPLLSDLPSSGHRLPALHRPHPAVPVSRTAGSTQMSHKLRATNRQSPVSPADSLQQPGSPSASFPHQAPY